MKQILTTVLASLLFFSPCAASTVGGDNNQFAIALFKKLDTKEENLAFSPYGLFSNLSLLYFGAEGQTKQQIKNALHISTSDEGFQKASHALLTSFTRPFNDGYQFKIASGLFPHKGTHFLKAFEKIATSSFEAKLQSVDYDLPKSALSTINQWVSEKTMGKIPTILEEGDIDKQTRLVVANAVYFEGEWVHPFKKELTSDKAFYRTDGSEVQVPNLEQTNFYPYFENDEVQVLALPILRHDVLQPFLECLILLPKKRGGLRDLEESLSPKMIDEIIEEVSPTLIDLHIPKFCFSKQISLKDPLKALGMEEPFTYQADFSKIDGMKDLFLNKVLHETYFSFHEKGITAASATTSNMGLTSIPPVVEPSTPFSADHPFLFMLVDSHSKTILFLGRVTDPKADACDED